MFIYCGLAIHPGHNSILQDFTIVSFDIKALSYLGTSLCIPFLYHVATHSILQVFIICKTFTNKVLLHFWKQQKVWRCQVRTVQRMLQDVPMELLMKQGMCLLGSTRTCIVLQQNNSTWELASSACRKRITPCTLQSEGFSIGTAMATTISGLIMWQGPTHSCMRQLFNITLNTRNQWLSATKQVCRLYVQMFFTVWMAFLHFLY